MKPTTDGTPAELYAIGGRVAAVDSPWARQFNMVGHRGTVELVDHGYITVRLDKPHHHGSDVVHFAAYHIEPLIEVPQFTSMDEARAWLEDHG